MGKEGLACEFHGRVTWITNILRYLCPPPILFRISKKHINIKNFIEMALEITDNNYKEILSEGKPLVIDFWAPWCGPCRMVSPIIDELAAEYEGKVVIGKCDVDENGDMAADFGIRSIPTVLFFKDGQLVDKQVGSAPKPTYVAKIEALLK